LGKNKQAILRDGQEISLAIPSAEVALKKPKYAEGIFNMALYFFTHVSSGFISYIFKIVSNKPIDDNGIERFYDIGKDLGRYDHIISLNV
jgi:hypothetical protein